MTAKLTLTALVIAVLPSLSLAMGCSGGHDQTAQMSCPEGQIFDDESSACVPLLGVTS